MHSRKVHLIGSFFAQSLESLRDYLVDLLLISPSDPCDLDDLDMLAHQAKEKLGSEIKGAFLVPDFALHQGQLDLEIVIKHGDIRLHSGGEKSPFMVDFLHPGGIEGDQPDSIGHTQANMHYCHPQ